MPAPTRTFVTRKELEDHVVRADTGRLTVGAGAAEIALFLLDGHVVACRASDDTSVLIDRMSTSGRLPEERAKQLRAMQEMSAPILGRDLVDPIVGLLFEEDPTDALDAILSDRFEENLARFLGHRGAPRWEADVLPWAYNIQIGHDSATLVRQAAAVWDLAVSLDDDDALRRGDADPTDDQGRAVASALDATARPVRELVAALDLPPVVARALLARAVQDGLAARDDEPEVEPEVEVEVDEEPPTEATPRPEVDETDVADEDYEDLDAFAGDADAVRGGDGAGAFVTERHNLDRVELVDLGDVPGGKETSYAAPTLSEDDARDKLQVANDVLRELARAYDEEKGSKAGRQAIQLLVDGRPRAYVALFDGLTVTTKGQLSGPALLANLRSRPETEQRHLLNQGLLDLVDRALDRAADELDEDLFDGLLGKVMGYRQRMGL